MINTKKTVKEINIKDILFRPQEIHHQWIKNIETKYGNDMDLEFKKAYHLIHHNLNRFKSVDSLNKYKALILLSDGLNTLTLIIHASLLGYGFECTVLLRYYVENLALSYGIFLNKELYLEWKNKPGKTYSNTFTKKGMDILNSKHSDLKQLWAQYSKISHIDFNTTGTSFISYNAVAIGGSHTPMRNKIFDINIQGAEMLLKLTVKIYKEDFGLI